MPAHDAASRVRLRILDWMKREGHGSKKRLAEAVAAKYGANKSAAWVTSIQRTPDNKGQDIRLKDLDAIAACLGMPAGELVSSYDRKYLELTMVEAKLVEYYRLLPETVRAHWVYWLDYIFRPHKKDMAAAVSDIIAQLDPGHSHASVRAIERELLENSQRRKKQRRRK